MKHRDLLPARRVSSGLVSWPPERHVHSIIRVVLHSIESLDDLATGATEHPVEHLVCKSYLIQWHLDADARLHSTGFNQLRDLAERSSRYAHDEVVGANLRTGGKRGIGRRHR